MTYNFDTVIDSRHTHSLNWNVAVGALPLWVADMDFQTAPEIQAALQRRVQHGVFGYSEVGGDWYDAYIRWWSSRHGYTMQKNWLMFCTGIVPAISSIVR